MPSCAAARPGRCPGCRGAGQPVGSPLAIVGHGVSRRQVCGPLTFGDGAQQTEIVLRRYRCRACSAILVVGPRGLLPRRWYGGAAIAGAVASYAAGATTPQVRALTKPAGPTGPSSAERWITLVRWLDAAERGELFGISDLGHRPRRVVAELVTLALAARAGRLPGDDLARCAFAAGSLAA